MPEIVIGLVDLIINEKAPPTKSLKYRDIKRLTGDFYRHFLTDTSDIELD